MPIPHGFHRLGTKLITVIDRMSLLIDGSALHSCFATDCIPLTSACIFKDLVVSARRSVLGCVIESGAGSILVADLKVSVLTMGSIHLIDLLTVAGHELLEGCLVVTFGCVSSFKLGNIRVLLHSIPVDPVGRLHDRVRRIGLLEIGAVVP